MHILDKSRNFKPRKTIIIRIAKGTLDRFYSHFKPHKTIIIRVAYVTLDRCYSRALICNNSHLQFFLVSEFIGDYEKM